MYEESEESADDAIDPLRYVCPNCDALVDAPLDPMQAFVRCAECGAEFLIVTDDEEQVSEEEEERKQAEELARRQAEIDNKRIEQIASIRRGTYRARSYCIIGVLACAITGIQLVLNTIALVKERGWQSHAIGYLCFVGVLCMTAIFLAKRAMLLQLELRRSHLSEPMTPPDFTTLSDGSERWKNLDQMTGDKED